MAVTKVFLTTTGGLQSWTVPSDFGLPNTIEVLGAGGTGGTGNGSGGGGGAYAKISNAVLTPGGSISYQVGATGAQSAAAQPSFFNGTTLGGSSVGADGAHAGGGKGTAAASIGTTKYDGGDGGAPGGGGGGGGGGAAGLHGAGGVGTSGSSGGGGTGDAGNTAATANGTQWDVTHGSGGGGNGSSSGGGAAGTYGAGGGGAGVSGGGGTGAQGLIVITYGFPLYWVGGTGTWDNSTATHWAQTSGGAGGVSTPISSNDVFIDGNSGAGTITLGANISAMSTTMTGYTGTLALSTFTLSLGGTGTIWTGAGTITGGTGTIKFTDASSSSKTFSGGSLTYNNLWLSGAGTGTFIITGSNTFNDFKCDTPPHTIQFQAGSITQTLNTFTVQGTAGNLMTLQSTVSGSPWYMKKSPSGTISCDYLSLQDSYVS